MVTVPLSSAVYHAMVSSAYDAVTMSLMPSPFTSMGKMSDAP